MDVMKYTTLIILLTLASTSSAADKISFRKQVWPIFKRHCWGCHNARESKGGLNMDTVKLTVKGGDSGKSIQPGKPKGSLLIDMISGPKPDMPKKQPPLSAAKIAIIRRWVKEGAKDDSLPSKNQLAVRVPKTYRFAPAITSVALHPKGNVVVAACRSEVVVWSLTGQPKRLHRLATTSDLVTNVQFSRDGKTLAVSGGSPSRFGEVRFYDTSFKLKSQRRIGTDTLFRGNFSPDGKTLALGGADGAVHLIPVDPKQKARKIDLHSDWVMDVAYSQDGKLLVSAGRDKAAKVSSPKSLKLLRQLDSSALRITAAASGNLVGIAGGSDRRLISYTYKIAIQNVAVSGAGNGSRPVSRRNQYAKALESQAGQIFDLSTDGSYKTLAVAGDFPMIRVYDVTTRKRLAEIKNVPQPAFAVSLSGDGKSVAVGTKSGQVLVYSLPKGTRKATINPVPVNAVSQVK